MKFSFHAAAVATALAALCQCSTPTTDIRNADVVVSVKDQKLGVYRNGQLATSYKISTSKFGIGDQPGSNCTPLGKHEVVAKIGHGLPVGAVLKSRQWNGEVVRPNAPGRDPIVSRILWLSGQESSNRNAYNRFIYIHGTTEEFRLGSPASYGCIRMAARDVVKVFDTVPIGATVVISPEALPSIEAGAPSPESMKPVPIPPLTPDSKPADTPLVIPSSVLAQQSKIQTIPGGGPMPVLLTKGGRKNDPETAMSSAPMPVEKTSRGRGANLVAAAPAQPDPAPKRRLFGLIGGKADQAAAAPAPVTPPVQGKTIKKSTEIPVAAATQAQPTSRKRFFGLGGGSSDPAPSPPAAPAPNTRNERTTVGPPKMAKPGKPGVETTATKAAAPKKRSVKKIANDSSDASMPTPPASGVRKHRSAQAA